MALRPIQARQFREFVVLRGALRRTALVNMPTPSAARFSAITLDLEFRRAKRQPNRRIR
ncbi:hypothetical protein IQ782_02775 [Salipiger pacificus]|uniref:Uncharacterized protein n=1 Tax=Salipiger mangrovisoli TaxID=2865933 RepID=A0ABR9WWT7_9RHOB|nr:hypothetical protein [Salipiger mangrovisoli]